MLIEKIIGKIRETGDEGLTVDSVLLSHFDLKKSHQKVTTSMGRELKISLNRGETLFCGAILYRDEKVMITVDMPREKVFEIMPRDSFEWAKAAYNIGNMHQSLYLYADRARIPYDGVLENTIRALDIPYIVTEAKLDGVEPGISRGHE